MKAKTLIKALNKAGIELKQTRPNNSNILAGELNGKVVELHVQGESVIVRCRLADDKDDFQSDYHAGQFFRTIKNVVAFMTKA